MSSNNPHQNRMNFTYDSELEINAARVGMSPWMYQVEERKHRDFMWDRDSRSAAAMDIIKNKNNQVSTAQEDIDEQDFQNYRFSHEAITSYKISTRDDGKIKSLRVHFWKNYDFEIYLWNYHKRYNSTIGIIEFDLWGVKKAKAIKGAWWDRQAHHINYFQNTWLKMEMVIDFLQEMLTTYHREKLA